METRDVILITSCILAFLGSSSIIITYLLLPTMKGNGRRLLMWLSVADAASSLNYILSAAFPPTDSSSFCDAQALIGIYFPVASFLWTDCIAWYLYQVVNHTYELNHDMELEHQKYLFPLFHAICWGIPGFICILIGSFSAEGFSSGSTGGWCWISSDQPHPLIVVWELVGGKGIEWFSCVVFVPFLYVSAYLRLRSICKMDPHRDKFHAFTRRLILVPVVFFFIRLWGSILAIQIMIGASSSNVLRIAGAFFDPSQGFF